MMDARPSRPSRPLPMSGNENIAPAKQILHQRHKSTGNFLSQPSAGGLQVPAKRTAFADRSNTSHGPSHNNTKMTLKPVPTASSKIVKAQENDVQAHAGPKDALLRPAQRPTLRSGASSSVLPSATNGYIPPLPSHTSHLDKQPISKRNTTIIYNDNQSDTFRHNLAGQKIAHPQEAAQDANPARQPRHHQSQPALSASQHAWNHPVSLDLNFSNPAPWDDAPAADTNEAPFLDAVEELPQEAQYALQGQLAEGPLIPVPSLPDPVDAVTKATARMGDFDGNLDPISDYDDDDYYDDQGYTTAHSIRSRGDNTTNGVTMVMFPPKLTKKGIAEVEAARDEVEAKRTEEDIEEEAWDISMVAEYADDIFKYMREMEMTLLPNAHYMDIQHEIQWSMRSVLIDWVVQVHSRFGLLPETLFLTINYIDRFLSYKVVSLGKLQLVGATAIFVAAKYEEINCPSVQEIVYMVDNGYSAEEILKAERFMLSMLNFELGWPGPMSFLRRISKADDYDLETRTLAKYFLEVTIMDERFVATPSSYIAAGAHCLSRLILDRGDWTPDHVYYSGYTFTQLKPLVGTILECCRIAKKHHSAVFDKYKDKRFKRAAVYVQNELRRGFSLPFQEALPRPVYDGFDEAPGPDGYAPSFPVMKMPIPTAV